MGNPVVRFEIGCQDKKKIMKFYADVFGWTMEPARFNTEVKTGGGSGIDGAITALGHEPHNYTMFYMEVPDADAACAKIKDHGGDVHIGPIDIPDNGGRFAWFKDPEGNMLAIWQAPA